MQGQTGSAVASSDETTLRHHRGKAPRPGMAPPRRKRCTMQYKSSSSPYTIRGRLF
jgi:hypothetical protein